jgi:hypothetical protein
MTAPFIFISTYAIKDGQLEAFREFLEELFGVLKPNVPGLLAINAYLDENGTEAAIVQVHTDVASMKEYWKVLHQHTGRDIAQYVDATTSTDVFGDPSGVVLERTRHSASAGNRLTVKPESSAGSPAFWQSLLDRLRKRRTERLQAQRYEPGRLTEAQ